MDVCEVAKGGGGTFGQVLDGVGKGRGEDISQTTPQNMHFNTQSNSRAHASKTLNQISLK